MTNTETPNPWHEPEDAPELSDDWFQHADQYDAGTLVQRGSPSHDKKQSADMERAMALETYAFDPAQFLTDPQSQAELLQDAMDTGDATYLAHAKATIARAKASLASSREVQTNTDQL